MVDDRNTISSKICAPSKDDEVPQVGMVFPSEEVAYDFYYRYARKVGFNIRKGKVERLKDGTIRKRLFICNREGQREICRKSVLVKRERPHTRTDCKARMRIKLEHNDSWVVIEVICEHNHPLASPSTLYMLRSQRQVLPVQSGSKDEMDSIGMKTSDGSTDMDREALEADSLDSMDVDNRNSLPTRRMRSLREGDTQIILDFFRKMQVFNPSFFYSIQVDKDGRTTNFFWADSRLMANYSYFGDVVCFDTAYLTNSTSLPFASFIGVNHNMQTILFGAALLLDGSTNSFVWLFETWMKAMSGKQPKTILTYQSSAIEEAIALVLTKTQHRLCLRQISLNATNELCHVYNGYSDFENDFKTCIYGYELEEDFEAGWNLMLKKYGLVENKWLKNLYEVRENWAPAYGRDTFTADMITIERSESINELFIKQLNMSLPLSKFLDSYEEALINERERELREDLNSKHIEPTLCIAVPMLKQAAKEYTRKVFEMFQEEYKKWLCCNIEICGEDGTVYTYRVTQFGQLRKFLVTFDTSDNTVRCSCKKFEFLGIQCWHVMKVLNYRSIFDLSSQYILTRWTNDSKTKIVRDNCRILVQADSEALATSRYSELCHMSTAIASKGALTEQALLVATCGLDKLLEEIEVALKRESAQQHQALSSFSCSQCKQGQTGRCKPPGCLIFPCEAIASDLSASSPTVPLVLSQSSQGSHITGDCPFSAPCTSQATCISNISRSCISSPCGLSGTAMTCLPKHDYYEHRLQHIQELRRKHLRPTDTE